MDPQGEEEEEAVIAPKEEAGTKHKHAHDHSHHDQSIANKRRKMAVIDTKPTSVIAI